jgi:hypothetical protein
MKITPPRPFALGTQTLVALALLGAACDKRQALVSQVATADDTFALTAEWPAFAQATNPKVDILFMVDNSLSMAPLQQKLAAGFSSFVMALESLPGGLPDVHLGVVTSDLGAGQFPESDIAGCRPGGDRGELQSAPRNPAACATGSVNMGQNFITASSVPGSGNYTGDLAAAFECLALVGEQGCGFEHQLGSVRRALDPAQAPMANVGFLRDDAFLAIILLTNEDDCSAPDDTTVYDPASQLVSDKLGPLASFRCNEYGHLCSVGGTYRPPSRTRAATYASCKSNEDGPLDKVGDFVTFLKNLKGDPARVFLAAITGPPTPYVVSLVPPAVADDPAQWPQIDHSCVASDGTFADPSVRIAQAVTAFGSHGLFASICDDTMGPLLYQISTAFSRPMATACVATPASSGPGCTVVDRWIDDAGAKSSARLPSCTDAAGTTPCWQLVADDPICGPGFERLQVERATDPVPPTLVTAIDCTSPHP